METHIPSIRFTLIAAMSRLQTGIVMRKQTRPWRRVTAWAILTAFVLAPLSCAPATSYSGSPSRHYDGRTLFQGFFFGVGPVARLFPELYGRVQQPDAASNAKMQRWMAAVHRADPSFFQRFEQLMNSRKRVNVERALNEGSDKLAAVFAAELHVSAEDIRAGRLPHGGELGLTILLPVAWAAAVFAAVVVENSGAVHYAVAITRHVYFWNKPGTARELYPGYGRESRLAQDRFVNVVVDRLGQRT